MKKILITGGAGFIGSNLALFLHKKGYSITVLDNLSKQIHGEEPNLSPLYNSIKDKVHFIHGSVTDRGVWGNCLPYQDIVIHLAAETGTGQSMYEIENYTNNNIMGTSIMWDLLANNKYSIKKVIIASSRAIYGEGKYYCQLHGNVYPEMRNDSSMSKGDFSIKCPTCNNEVELLPTSEDSKIHPTSIYGFTKQAQEEMSMIAGKSLGIPVVALRYQNVYGPGQSLSNPYTGILSIFSTRIKNGNPILIFEDGEESRDFVYIDDVVNATTLALENDISNFKSYNVGSGVKTSVLSVARTLISSFETSVEISISGNYRIGDIRHNFADLNKIKHELGFYPQWNFESGIAQFVKWVNNQKTAKDDYDFSMEEMKKKGLFK